MLTYDEYMKRKKKKNEEETNKKDTSSSNSNGVLTYEQYMEKNKKSLKDEDLAPVKTVTPQKDGRTWLSKGAFSDGYQAGDITKTILGTITDINEDLNAGIIGMGEKVVDAGAYLVGGVGGLLGADGFKNDMQDFIKKDLYDEEKIAKSKFNFMRGGVGALYDAITKFEDSDKNSVMGEKADSLVQSGGQLLATVGLQSVGVPWFVTTGVTSFGGEVDNAFKQGATYGQAGLSATITAGADILTEKLFGGSGLGEKGLINLDKLTKGISSKVVKSLVDFGVDMTAEGTEEVIAGVFSNLGTSMYKEENIKDILWSEEATDEYIESFIGGAVLGGGMNAGKLASNIKTKTDYRSGVTQNEQKLIDNIKEKRIAEAEKEGEKLSNKKKNKIEQDIMRELERGEIDIDTIESTLGGESYTAYDSLVKEAEELKNLNKIKYSELTGEQSDRLAELKEKNKVKSYSEQLAEARNKLSSEVDKATQNDMFIRESYNERGRRGEAFTVSEEQLKKYSEKERAIVQKAIEYGEMNNTRKAHEFVDLVAKLSADKGVSFDFTNNEKLKNSGFAIEGKTINGFKQGNSITINLQSKNALNSVVGHEITHVLEGTDLYQSLQDTVIEYAKQQGVYDAKFKDIVHLYRNQFQDNNLESRKSLYNAELTADLVGEYIFSDTDFVRNLSTKDKGLFQKVYDEIKYMVKKATAGSDAEKQLIKAKKIFEEVYRDTRKNTSDKTQLSVADNKGRTLSKEQQDFLADSKIRDDNGNLKTMYHGSPAQFTIFDKKKARSSGQYGSGFYFSDSESHAGQYGKRFEVYLNIKNPLQDGQNNITKEQLQKFVKEIAENEDYGIENYGYGSTVDSVVESVYGKDDFSMLMDINASCVGNMVEAVELFNEVNGTNYDGIVAQTETVAFYPNQVKNVDNTKPTDNEDIRFSVSDNTKETDNNIKHEVTDFHNDEMFAILSYEQDGKVVGTLEYSEYNGEPSVKMVEVDEKHRRKGIGTKLLQELQRKYPNTEINLGMTTEDGTKLLDNITYTVENKEVIEKFARAKELESKLAEYDETLEKFYNDEIELQEGYAEDYNELYDELVDLKKELRGKKKTKTFIKTDSDVKFSLTDNQGNKINPLVQKRFANSKAVDENGDLKVLYHGTYAGDFSIFDKTKGSVEGDFGSGFYFTDNISDVEANYEGGGPDFENKIARRAEQIEYEEEVDYNEAKRMAREELFKGSNKFEVYLNIENPAIVGETRLLDMESYMDNYNEEDFEDYDEYMEEVERLIADDIDNVVWDIDRNLDVYGDTSAIANVLWESINEGGLDIADLKHKINELYLEDGEGNLIGNEVTRQIIESLGYDGIIDNTVSSKFNMNLSEDTTHYIVFKPNQIKAITNQNPTSNPDINLSLTDNNRPSQRNKNNIYAEDLAIQQTQEAVEDIAPTEDAVQEETNVQDVDWEDFAPMTEEEALARDENEMERLMTMQEGDMPPEIDAPIYEKNEVKDPFYDRDIKEVGKRNVNAYMYENPEVKPYFQEEAKNMLGELRNSIKGERVVNAQVLYETNGEFGVWGTNRMVSEEIAYLLDNFNYTYADIEKGLNAIIEDNGKENNAISKRIEFMLDERLREGYTYFLGDYDIPPNQDYIALLANKQITEYSDEAYNEWVKSLIETEGLTNDVAPVDEKVAQTHENTSQTHEMFKPSDEQNVQGMKTLPLPQEHEVKGVKMNKKEASKGEIRSWVETSTESDVVNFEILPADLDQSAIYYQPISNKKTLDTANADLDRMGYDKALQVFNSKMESRTLSLSDIALGERLVQESLKRGDKKTTSELIQDISILGTELGQKVQALSIIQRMTPEGQLKMLQKIVNRGKAKGDNTFKNVEVTDEMVDDILSAYNDDGTYDQDRLNGAVEKAKQKIADQMEVTAMDRVNAWRMLAMLGNPKTHIRNIVSNITMQATNEMKNALARTIETVAPIKNRTKTWKSASEDVKAFAEQSTKEAEAELMGEHSYSENADIKAKRKVFGDTILQKVYDFNSNMLTKEDAFFKRPVYRKSLQEFLTANGIKTQEDINNNKKLVEKGKQYALEQAQIATFQQYSWLANKINEIERKNVATQIGVGSVIPFKKTPINIAKTGLAYSPLGFAKSLSYDLVEMKKGNLEASQVIDNLSKGATGSALTYIGYMLAMSGLLNGGGEDDKEGKYDYQLGEQSYSLNFGGNTYSLSWLTPVAMPLFVGANAYEMAKEGKELTFDTTMDAMAQTLDPMSEMSFLSSLDSVLTSYESGAGKFMGIFETAGQNYATQFAPTLVSQIAQVTDDKKRSTQVSADSDARIIEQTINKLKYKIPGLRQTLEPTIDIWGNEVKQSENVIERAVEAFIAPYSRKDGISTEIDAEIKDLYSQTGDDGIIPNVPSNKVKYGGETYKMSANEFADYKKTYGQTANELMEDLFNTTTYKNADNTTKAEMVNRVYDYASDVSKKEYLEKEGVQYTNTTENNVPVYKENKIKGAIDNDMMLGEFDLYSKSVGKYEISKVVGGFDSYTQYNDDLNDLKADKDKNGKTISGSRKEKTVEYINTLPMDYGQKIILFKSRYKADDTYNYEIIDYLNSREDISYEQMVSILTELDFEVADDGTVRWK